MDEVKRKIGGTQISRIFGLSRWGGPMDAYLSLTGIVEDEVTSDAAYWGKEAQPAILKRYIKETGTHMVICDQTYQHPEYDFITFTPDCLVSPTFSGIEWPKSPHIVELKETTIRENYGAPGTDAVSDETALQCQLYMGCCGAKTCDVAVHFLRPKHEFAIFPLTFNQKIFDNIIEKAREFWTQHVVPQVPPELDASDASTTLLRHIYPDNRGEVLPAPDDAYDWRTTLTVANQMIKDYEEQKKLAQHHLEALVGDADSLLFLDGARFDWKRQKGRVVVDWEGLARSFEPAPSQISEYTITKPGIRVARLWPSKEKKNGN